MVKVLGFILGIVVALAGPAAFGVLATGGDVDLNAKETAIVYAVWALALWIAASLGAGAGALGAALTFGAMTYAVHFVPNRTTDFLNDVPGVTGGMIEGLKKTVLDGLTPVLTVILLVYAIQLMVLAVRRRSQLRAEEARAEEADQRERLAAARRDETTDADATSTYPSPYHSGTSGDTGEQTRVFAQQGQHGQHGQQGTQINPTHTTSDPSDPYRPSSGDRGV